MSYRRWVLVSFILFVLGAGVGLLTPRGSTFLSEEIAYLAGMAKLFKPFTPGTVVFVFTKNSLSLLMSFILSPFLLIVPVLSLFVNGWLLAFIGAVAAQRRSLVFVLLGILPHGVFELTAFILGEAAALSFGAMVISAIFNKEKRAELVPNLKNNLKRLGIALALLLPAAVIETYVTPLLIK